MFRGYSRPLLGLRAAADSCVVLLYIQLMDTLFPPLSKLQAEHEGDAVCH